MKDRTIRVMTIARNVLLVILGLAALIQLSLMLKWVEGDNLPPLHRPQFLAQLERADVVELIAVTDFSSYTVPDGSDKRQWESFRKTLTPENLATVKSLLLQDSETYKVSYSAPFYPDTCLRISDGEEIETVWFSTKERHIRLGPKMYAMPKSLLQAFQGFMQETK
jgi:hypothetical protein